MKAELKLLQKYSLDNVFVYPESEQVWLGSVYCDRGSYESALFKFRLVFPDDYPERPIDVSFESPVFHPQINYDNGACQIREKTVAETLL